MLTTELKVEIFKYFTKSYAELLEKFIYKDKKLVNQLLKSPKNKDAYESLVVHYFNAITDFYRRYPDGTYLEELEYVKNNPQVKKSAKEYLDLTGDETLIRFLQVYSYCVQEPSGLIYDKNYKVVKALSESYFSQARENALAMFTKFEKDIKEGNYWWLKNSATTLRRQLFEDIIVLSEKRFSYLCETYFDRPVDIRKEFINAKNGGEKLVPELDATMAKRYKAKPYYCWWEIRADGKNVLHMLDTPPEEGIYTYVAYHDRQENRTVEKDNYYL